MKDIPVFTGGFGAAGLTLSQIPYTGKAYIKIHASSQPEELLKECVQFCRACGAEAIFASGKDMPENYPVSATLITMSYPKDPLVQGTAVVVAATDETIDRWLEIYRQKMRNIPNASYISDREAGELLKSESCYFVWDGDTLLGIGKVSDDRLEALAACVPGAGERVLRALATKITADTVILEVARENVPAMRLYQLLGFTEYGEKVRWYQVF